MSATEPSTPTTDLYSRIRQLRELDRRISEKRGLGELKFGDSDIVAHDALVREIGVLSASDVMEYHNVLVEEDLRELRGELTEELQAERNNEKAQYEEESARLQEDIEQHERDREGLQEDIEQHERARDGLQEKYEAKYRQGIEALRTGTLDALRRISSPDAFPQIADVVNSLYNGLRDKPAPSE
jgi:hypothetical protein